LGVLFEGPAGVDAVGESPGVEPVGAESDAFAVGSMLVSDESSPCEADCSPSSEQANVGAESHTAVRAA
jgi:hypothetical protein